MSKHIPILFSTEMVRAILDGRKTQTRRVVKASPKQKDWLSLELINNASITSIGDSNSNSFGVQLGHPLGGPLTFIKCPYGQPGDVLWVRESFAPFADKPWNTNNISYKTQAVDVKDPGWKWKPSIHMPKEACRLWLKVKAVRVERLQEISEADALAEGIARAMQPLFQEMRYMDYLTNELHGWRNPASSFQSLWHKINGPESWNANPWVWVVEFERCEMPDNFLSTVNQQPSTIS